MTERSEQAAAATPPAVEPRWWTPDIETAWITARTRTLSSWGRSGRAPRGLLRRVTEAAVRLGFGAHRAFPETPAWTIDLEARLEREWATAHHDGDSSWERVSSAARHGWETSYGVPALDPRAAARPVHRARTLPRAPRVAR